MAYDRTCGGPHPCCMILLIDQSGSMELTFGANSAGKGRRRCDMVATIVNRFISDLISAGMKGATVSPRADVAVLGYGGDSVQSALPSYFAGKDFATLQELAEHPLRTEPRETQEVDDTGRFITVLDYFNVWVEPRASNATPMRKALTEATRLASNWAASHPDNYPPVIVNITDGAATDCGDDEDSVRPALEDIARKLCAVHTSDGNALLYNCHITGAPTTAPIEYPVVEPVVPSSPEEPYLTWLAPALFSISSILPETALAELNATLDMTGKPRVSSGARGFIFNGDASSVLRLVTFASQRATGLDMSK